jgi:hypothetical protein
MRGTGDTQGVQQVIRRLSIIRRPPPPPSVEVLKYWEWIRQQPCCVCVSLGMKQRSKTEVSHVGARGLGQKCVGQEVLPLCAYGHHREGILSHHKLSKRFWIVHGLNRFQLLLDFQERYFLENDYKLASPELRASLWG